MRKINPMITQFSAFFCLTIATLFYAEHGYAEKDSKRKDGPPGSHSSREAWDNLSEEEQTKLKEALRKVWSDPAVVSAREDIERASDAYRAAMKESISKGDPAIAALLQKVQSANEGEARARIGGRPPMGFGKKRDFERLIHPPGFLENLNERQREKYKKAEAAARESEEMKAAMASLETMRREDASFQKKRIEIFRNVRKTFYQEMVKFDPELEEIIPRGGPSEDLDSSKRRKKGPKEKGSKKPAKTADEGSKSKAE